MWPFELHSPPLLLQNFKQTLTKPMAGILLLSSGCSGGGPSSTTASSPAGGCGGDKNQLSLVALLLAAIRRSMVSCRMESRRDDGVAGALAELEGMEIGWPTDVRHVAHVTFDRFNGFLGLPVEFEHEIPGRVPSASASVFGVSAESMQCCYDSKGNSVPTILLLMQERLYTQGGLKAEGIFRINPENSQEEQVRDQLNRGIVPDDIDVHCLAGLIKAWFRELPEGVLDGLSPEQVLQCNTEEEFVELVKLLLPTPAALLNWAVNLMADVVEEEEINKMNARNIAMVFAPNMTQMSDPLTALMHAVQVMNLLKALILKTLREREEVAAEDEYSAFSSSPSFEQQGEDDLDSEKEMDMRGELKEVDSNDCIVNYYNSSLDDEHGAVNDIEDCFLKRLEWKGHVADLIRDSISLDFSSSDQTTQWTYSDLNVGSGLSLSKSEHESPRTSNSELHAEAKSRRLECMEGDQVEMEEAASETSKLALCLHPC